MAKSLEKTEDVESWIVNRESSGHGLSCFASFGACMCSLGDAVPRHVLNPREGSVVIPISGKDCNIRAVRAGTDAEMWTWPGHALR